MGDIVKNDIIEKIDSSSSNLKEEDLDWIVPQLLDHFKSNIKYWAKFAYSESASQLSYRAFSEQAKENLRKACHSFLFKHQHWRSNRSIGPYLAISLKFLAWTVNSNNDIDKKVSILICPACKTIGQKIYLTKENGQLHCGNCKAEVERLNEEKNLGEYLNNLSRLHNIFSIHSQKGYRCPDCSRFIPTSYIEAHGCSCPFNDCSWFGSLKELQPISHPTTLAKKEAAISIQSNRYKSQKYEADGVTWEDTLDSDVANPEEQVELEQRLNREYKILKEIIEKQSGRVKYVKSIRSIQKQLMYQAYKNTLEKYPDEMVSYLVHLNYNREDPIQCKIFQEFARLVENHLPFTITKGNKEIEIFSLQDPALDLFLGVSEFEAKVDKEGFIPNNTAEEYIGARKYKNYGPCFIGRLISLHTDNDEITDEVEHHTFVKIKVSNKIKPGTKVKVKHLRIYPHYEQGPTVLVQKVRRNIGKSVERRLSS